MRLNRLSRDVAAPVRFTDDQRRQRLTTRWICFIVERKRE